MSKCKRNILLVFGYLLTVSLLVLPTQNIFYNTSGERAIKNKITFIPFYISKGIKYKKYKKWISSWPSPETKKDIDIAKKAFTKLLRETEKELELLKKSDRSPERSAAEIKLEDQIKYIKSKSNDVEINIKRAELTDFFGKRPYYHKLRFEFFITEIAIIIITAGFAYILFCVVLRKSEKKGEK